jgi:hypothetical protein
MHSKYWQVIRDDSKRTFEVCGQASDTNSFTNKTYGMQKAGMNVSCMTLPVGTKIFTKDAVIITGYSKEDGLYERLLKEYRERMMPTSDDFHIDD